MTIENLLMDYWQWNIPAGVITAVLLVFHFITNRYRFTRKSINFFIGIILFVLLTFSPIEYFGHYYLFSVHMIQHIVLLLIIPPLLLTGTDSEYLLKLFSAPVMQKYGKFLFYPVVAWMLGVGAMWIWHAPLLFIAMLRFHIVHIIEILSLLTFGIVFAWPVFAPVRFRKLNPLSGSLYLFTACIGCTILGILITFAPPGFFTSYLPGHNAAILNFLQVDMGITPAVDQEAAGLIMWVPACLVYLTIIMILMARWYRKPEDEKEKDYEPDNLHLP